MNELSHIIADVAHRLAIAERTCEDHPGTAEGRLARDEIMRSLDEDIIKAHGARIVYGQMDTSVHIAGIHASGAPGLAAALRNWLVAAERQKA